MNKMFYTRWNGIAGLQMSEVIIIMDDFLQLQEYFTSFHLRRNRTVCYNSPLKMLGYLSVGRFHEKKALLYMRTFKLNYNIWILNFGQRKQTPYQPNFPNKFCDLLAAVKIERILYDGADVKVYLLSSRCFRSFARYPR